MACLGPFLQVLVRTTEVVQRDRLFAQHPRLALLGERRGVDVARLGIVAHAVVEDRDAVHRRERVMAQAERFEEALRAAQVREAERILALQAEHVAAREERARQHLVVARLGGAAHGLLEEDERLRIVAERLAQLALAGQQSGPQARPLAAGKQGLDGLHLHLARALVALGGVVAQEQPRPDLEIGIGTPAQRRERRFGVTLARLGIGTHRARAALAERGRRVR